MFVEFLAIAKLVSDASDPMAKEKTQHYFPQPSKFSPAASSLQVTIPKIEPVVDKPASSILRSL